jgi:hypothetical protein
VVISKLYPFQWNTDDGNWLGEIPVRIYVWVSEWAISRISVTLVLSLKIPDGRFKVREFWY